MAPSPFRLRALDVIRAVPAGAVTTYGDVAAVAGAPAAARQVGYALAALPEDTDVPWHRVINAQGTISARGDTLRALEQEARLAEEGVRFGPDGRCDLARLRFRYDAFRPG